MSLLLMTVAATTFASDKLKVGDAAPLFSLKNQKGDLVKLEDRKGKGWTVLFFYPKAGTPGCTKQACAFRDSVKVIRDQGAEIYGISGDTVEEILKFHNEHKLTFSLLSDPDAKVIDSYGAKILALKMAKRWTFIVDPDLKIRSIDDNVDPVMDPKRVSDQLNNFKARK